MQKKVELNLEKKINPEIIKKFNIFGFLGIGFITIYKIVEKFNFLDSPLIVLLFLIIGSAVFCLFFNIFGKNFGFQLFIIICSLMALFAISWMTFWYVAMLLGRL